MEGKGNLKEPSGVRMQPEIRSCISTGSRCHFPMADNQAKATPARVLMLFTFLMAAVAASAWRQHSAVVSPNTIDFPTALGDTQFCPVAVLTGGQPFAARIDGTEALVNFQIGAKIGQEMEEDQMRKAGLAESGEFFLYQPEEAMTESLWVKSAVGQFYPVVRP